MVADPFWSKFENTPFNPMYHLQKLLGVGAFGAVFLASEVIADREVRRVALKVFSPLQPVPVDRLLEELRTATTLKHPYLLDCYSPQQGKLAGMLDVFGLVMELASESLEQRLNRGLLSGVETASVVHNLADVLSFLHRQKLVHRDLKPANILRVNDQWKLGDLGIVKALGDRTNVTTRPSSQVGTFMYMPPEAYSGRVDPRWDVWSLGIMIIEVLTAQHPFPGTTPPEIMQQVLNQSPQLPASLPPTYRDLVQGCLVKDYERRWTAQQVLEGLRGQTNAGSKEVGSKGGSFSQPSTRSCLSHYSESLPRGVSLEMLPIQGGEFWMGSPAGEGSDYERPRHRVTLSGFYVGKYPVTNAQWKGVMGNDPSSRYGSKFMGEQQPVVGVSWRDAIAFCRKLSKLTQRPYRLLSEAEFEYACRAGTETKFSFGDDEKQLGNYAWYSGNSGGQTHPVGQKQPNGFGLYDMQGNVWEWCQDIYQNSYQGAPTDGSAWELGDKNSIRVLRGGSWYSDPANCRCANRNWGNPGDTYSIIGFRVGCAPSRT